MNSPIQTPISSVYGPVLSWRVGNSLGIDLIRDNSVCSFNCVYCQLGYIQNITNQRRVFVPTETVLHDFQESRWREADMITYSGNGEPTLATNIGEVALGIKNITSIPQLCLTNGTTLGTNEVVDQLQHIDRVYVKLDAASETVYQRVNRPVSGIALEHIIENIVRFRKEYQGFLGIQCMFLPLNVYEVDAMAEILTRIEPDEVQLNTPTRPYPKEWHYTARGGHSQELREYEGKTLKTICLEVADSIEQRLKEKTGLNILSVYQKSNVSTPSG